MTSLGPDSVEHATTPAPEPRAFETVLRHIERLILEQELLVGDRLPPERDLALQLGVSRPAVREAIRTLEAQGVLASRVGSGASAGTHVIRDRSQALGRLLRLQVALAQFPIEEVVVARITLETTTAALAAQHVDEEQLEQLDELLRRMDEAADQAEYNELDTAFHVLICQFSGNALVGDLTQAVRESLREPIAAAERRLDDWPALQATLSEQHRGIVAALRARDAELAAARSEEHIRTAYQVMPLGAPLG